MQTTGGHVAQVVALAAQIALMVASFALGGPGTRAGGLLMLLSLWCLGANVGWFMRGGE